MLLTKALSAMNTDKIRVLESLIEDNGDKFGCFETIEPYINADRSPELDATATLKVLTDMAESGLIRTYLYRQEKDQFELNPHGKISKRSWFMATESGIQAYNKRLQAT